MIQHPFNPLDNKYRCFLGLFHVKTGTYILCYAYLAYLIFNTAFELWAGAVTIPYMIFSTLIVALIFGGALYALATERAEWLIPYLVSSALTIVCLVVIFFMALLTLIFSPEEVFSFLTTGPRRSWVYEGNGHNSYRNLEMNEVEQGRTFGMILLFFICLMLVIAIKTWMYFVVYRCYQFFLSKKEAARLPTHLPSFSNPTFSNVPENKSIFKEVNIKCKFFIYIRSSSFHIFHFVSSSVAVGRTSSTMAKKVYDKNSEAFFCCCGCMRVTTGTCIICVLHLLYIAAITVIAGWSLNWTFGVGEIIILVIVNLVLLAIYATPLIGICAKTAGWLWPYIIVGILNLIVSFGLMIASLVGLCLGEDEANLIIAINSFSWVIPTHPKPDIYIWLGIFATKNLMFIAFGSWFLMVVWNCKSYLRDLENDRVYSSSKMLTTVSNKDTTAAAQATVSNKDTTGIQETDLRTDDENEKDKKKNNNKKKDNNKGKKDKKKDEEKSKSKSKKDKKKKKKKEKTEDE